MYGRGTSDCKGGVTCGVMAIKSLLEVAEDLSGTLIFQSVVDEECNGSGAGTLACIERGYVGDQALFVDGNDDTVTIGCSGCLTAAVHVQGKAGHAARGTGVNAVEKGVVVQQAISAFKHDRESARPDARLNLGIFHGGTHPAVVPARSRLELNMVYQLDEAEASERQTEIWGGAVVREQFEAAIRKAESNDDWLAEHPSEIVWVKDLVPFDEPADQPLVEHVCESFVSVTGSEPEVSTMVAWTDAAWPSAYAGMPTVLFGPGVSSQPHTDSEYVELDNLPRCTKVLALHLLREMS
jgi:acetylornithine deacetylase